MLLIQSVITNYYSSFGSLAKQVNCGSGLSAIFSTRSIVFN